MINSRDDLPSCDHLHIRFDTINSIYNKGKDLACLSVLRKKGRGMEVISTFYGEEAEWLYARLSNGPSDRAPQFMRSDMFKKILSGEEALWLSEIKENFKKYMNDIADEQ